MRQLAPCVETTTPPPPPQKKKKKKASGLFAIDSVIKELKSKARNLQTHARPNHLLVQCICCQIQYCLGTCCSDDGLSAIRRINHYPVDSHSETNYCAIQWIVFYLGDGIIHLLSNCGFQKASGSVPLLFPPNSTSLLSRNTDN